MERAANFIESLKDLQIKVILKSIPCGMSGEDILSNMNIIHGEVRAEARLE